jgi:hypothetical protein
VVWEVEVEAGVVAKLSGAFVGFLNEDRDHQAIQQNFILDGYSNVRITPLGHLKVLISSSVAEEVRELVGTVGWWCTWFNRFEEWSPELVSNQRVSWLSCFGVPLHAWGEALFRTLGFKFGTFIKVDDSTKELLRGDVARIKVATTLPMKIDSSVTVSVLGKKFLIKVMEEVGKVEEDRVCCCVRGLPEQENHSQVGGGDGGSVAAVVEGFSEEGSESDWSVGSQEVQVLGKQEGRQRRVRRSMIRVGKGIEVSGKNPNLLGNVLGDGMAKVNQSFVDKGEEVGESNRAECLCQRRQKGCWRMCWLKGGMLKRRLLM